MSNLLRRSRAALAVTVATGALIAVGSPAGAAAAPTNSASASFLMDGTTGATLAYKGGDTKRQMASTTKITTAVVVLTTPGLDLNKKVTIKQEYRDYVVREGASTANLKAGATPTVRQLLYAMMLPSGCDAAYALADTFGSGATTAARTKDFIAKMNAKAKSLGMTNTTYDSFDGISPTVAGNVTTARDLAKMTRFAMRSSTFKSIVKTTAISSGGTATVATWTNTNELLQANSGHFAPGAIGVKTGTGSIAGRCIVFSATRNGKTVIGVLLNDDSRYPDANKLIDWAVGPAAGAATLRSIPPRPDVLD
ncbi:serine hydrolase [Streptomyces sp. NBC_00335]|uniref:D-alanyl-D-alanine carboxypeptidase family protein n=1 Tax=unclassified Streptomyces TaxID=2593676 RepID=UPI00225C14F5|nr:MULTISPECIES: serine hydrolase [unclassified Streptomyces]MCX5406465.1 serine hydrolase [Streptomyces sp. NBC_00086]